MAAVKNKTDSKMMIRVENGTSSTGATVIKNLSYSQIRVEATDDELMAAGKAIADLQTKPLSGIRLVETYDVTAEGE